MTYEMVFRVSNSSRLVNGDLLIYDNGKIKTISKGFLLKDLTEKNEQLKAKCTFLQIQVDELKEAIKKLEHEIALDRGEEE